MVMTMFESQVYTKPVALTDKQLLSLNMDLHWSWNDSKFTYTFAGWLFWKPNFLLSHTEIPRTCFSLFNISRFYLPKCKIDWSRPIWGHWGWLGTAFGFLESSSVYNRLIHLPQVPPVCVSESCQHWYQKWLVPYSAPRQYLNQCLVIVNWTLRNKLQ